MDNIFDIYSAKFDKDKITEWDSNLLFPDWYAPTNPLDYRLCALSNNWLFQTITDYYCHKGAFKTVKIRTNTLSFVVRTLTLIYLLILKVSCHRSFLLPKYCLNKMDNIFDIYCAKVDNDKVTEWDSNLLLPNWYAPTNQLDYRLCW